MYLVYRLDRLIYTSLDSKNAILFKIATFANMRCYLKLRHVTVRTLDFGHCGKGIKKLVFEPKLKLQNLGRILRLRGKKRIKTV